MKYPEYRISMEAALPSSVHGWLKQELEHRGIDSLVYTRYIIRILQQDNEDLDSFDSDSDVFCKPKVELKQRGKRTEKKKLSVNDEERKKLAAIKCLLAISDEKAGIEELVEELCTKLKNCEIQAAVSPVVKRSCSSSDCSDDSGHENPAQRYYAAFPSLHGQEKDKESSPNITPPPPTVTIETIWKNNPLVKHLLNTHSGDDSSSANEDAEIKKINKHNPINIQPKYRKSRKNNSRNNRINHEQRKTTSRSNRSRSTTSNQRNKKEKLSTEKSDNFSDWPPGFVKLDPDILKSIKVFDDSYIAMRTASPKRQNEELCTKVESMLKGMLLPAPEKTYKDLQDVDNGSPIEQLERVNKLDKLDEKDIDIETLNTGCDSENGSESPLSGRDESLSPELQEQEIWYTQPIDVIFHSQDDEVSSSKFRLYKRNSYPTFSPDPDSANETNNSQLHSAASSPVFARSRSISYVSDDIDEDSDDIWAGSALIPAWLTDEIFNDENEAEDSEGDNDVFLIDSSLKASSPYPQPIDNDLSKTDHIEPDFAIVCQQQYQVETDEIDLTQVHINHWSTNTDDHATPTTVEQLDIEVENSQNQSDVSLSVSLVDLGYLSQFMVDSDWKSFTLEDNVKMMSPRRLSLTSLWQSKVLFDYTELPFEIYDSPCWQPLGNPENPFSQLWDVNCQKRSPKFSPWNSSSIYPPDGQVWVAENCLVYHEGVKGLEIEVQDKGDVSVNTLIPCISINVMMDGVTDYRALEEEKNETDNDRSVFFDRSFSTGDVPSLWGKVSHKVPDPKLSKSFELVPSETSAFDDVPKNLLHVHSEPNLVQFRQEFTDGNPSKPKSPDEHLYLSPKTHFRPITPAFAPELTSSNKSKQQVCQDLFGGIPSTKTPYQQFHHTVENLGSDDETFVPKFKLKNYSKSIQTGESFDKQSTPEEELSEAEEERDTPETLTLGIIEDIMGEKDDLDYLVTISEDLDAGNTDSAYETDYGISAMESEQDNTGTGGAYYRHKNCCYNRRKESDQYDGVSGDSLSTHGGQTLGDAVNYRVDSFVATYPHTQDWPDVSQSAPASNVNVDTSTSWVVPDASLYKASCWSQGPEIFPSNDLTAGTSTNLDNEQVQLPESHHTESYDDWGSQTGWSGHLVTDHFYSNEDAERYKNVWSTAGQDLYSVDIGKYFPVESQQDSEDKVSDDQLMSDSTESFYPDIAQQYPDIAQQYPDIAQQGDQVTCTVTGYNQHESSPVAVDCNTVPVIEEMNVEARVDSMFAVDEGVFSMATPMNQGPDGLDYHSVRLVYRGQTAQDQQSVQKVYGDHDFTPMPDAAVMSADLEKVWMDPEEQALYLQQCKPSSLQAKPCSFYLEGNCRRADCKFAHDISNLTCRFWEEGGCFKGPLCPFLHGYPSHASEKSPSPEPVAPPSVGKGRETFNLHTEEFPELSLTVKNVNSNSSSGSFNKINKSKSRTIMSGGRRDKGRKGGARRHSNKENVVEVIRIEGQCSNSV